MKIVIKEMVKGDIDETIRVMKEAWNHSYETWEKDYYPREAHEFDLCNNTVENHMKYLGDEESFCFTARADGKIAGRIAGQIIGKSGFGMIRSIAVHPEYYRKGVGKKLLETALGHLRKRGCHKVSLHTLPVLIPAINLYLKAGFVPEAYLTKQWWGVDFIYMSKWLD